MEKDGYLLQYDCLTGDEHRLWYIASRFSSLIEINRVTGEAKELFSLKKEGEYRSLIKDGDRLLLVPTKAEYLWIYDIKNKTATSRLIPNEMFQEGQNWSVKYIKFKQNVYFSWASPVIVKYDLLNDKWIQFIKWRTLLPKDCKYENWFPNEAFFRDGFLYFQIGTSHRMLKLNLDNDEFDVLNLHIPEQVISIDNIAFLDDKLWMECRNDNNMVSIYQCRDWYAFECEKILDLNVSIIVSGGIKMFSIMEMVGDELLLLPGSYDKTYLLNVSNKQLYVSNQYPAVSCDKLTSDWLSIFNYYKGLRLGNQFLVIHSWTHQLIEINKNGNSIKKIPIFFSDEVLDKIVGRELDNSEIHNEGVLGLDDFIHYVCYRKI